jgi:hypothetical protein
MPLNRRCSESSNAFERGEEGEKMAANRTGQVHPWKRGTVRTGQKKRMGRNQDLVVGSGVCNKETRNAKAQAGSYGGALTW